MSCLKVKDISASLLKKGFRVDSKQGNTDHIYYRLFNGRGEKMPITTKISRGDKEIRDPLIKRMAEQLKLKKKDFIKYVDCEITMDEYLEMVKDY